jgi:dimethylglycine dehydrogenase
LWFAPKGVKPIDKVSFHRSNDFKHVKKEVQATRNSVGVTEIANFAKYAFTGEGAETFLSRLMTNKMPKVGRIVLTPMLNENGKLSGDFTIAKAKDGHFYMWGSSQAQKYHMRWFEKHLPDDGSVRIQRLDMGMVGLSICGPKSRDVLQALTDTDVSGAAFKFMDHRAMDVANCPAHVNRMTYTGDLGYEIWVKPEYQRRLYDAIMKAGKKHKIVNFGMRALLSMRLEKNFPTWYRELRPIYGAFEAGLDRFVDLTKNDFIGLKAARAEKESGGKLRRVSMVVQAGDADVLGDEPIWHKDKVVGWVTSGGFGHHVGKSIAQGYIPKELVGEAEFEIELIGKMRKARINHEPLFDPKGERMRG